jgi:hypothetical protein
MGVDSTSVRFTRRESRCPTREAEVEALGVHIDHRCAGLNGARSRVGDGRSRLAAALVGDDRFEPGCRTRPAEARRLPEGMCPRPSRSFPQTERRRSHPGCRDDLQRHPQADLCGDPGEGVAVECWEWEGVRNFVDSGPGCAEMSSALCGNGFRLTRSSAKRKCLHGQATCGVGDGVFVPRRRPPHGSGEGRHAGLEGLG